MAIVLQKGQKIDLTKGHPGLEKIIVGLGWDPVVKKASGLRGLLGGGGGAGGSNMDIDASVIMLQDDKFVDKSNLIYFGNLKSKCGSVTHTGDNTTGDGDGDDEQVLIDLKKVPTNINKMVFVVNIYDCVKRKQDFGQVENAFIRVMNSSNNEELLKFSLSENYAGSTSLTVAEIYRHGNEWKFGAVGSGSSDAGLSEMVKRYS
ncbi:TerD family protein [Filibacter tadaridae]|uniref:Stress response protein SCP2 n=1 Tax=Filibacter tadaridae TaxID=2483811 RepID=A0A3P5WZK6_9BACL|nr:TerD family protein [Filibacter tadaridae]VDC21009.1 Stress response protein SCP2 [Filibacter tadaridae]